MHVRGARALLPSGTTTNFVLMTGSVLPLVQVTVPLPNVVLLVPFVNFGPHVAGSVLRRPGGDKIKLNSGSREVWFLRNSAHQDPA